MKYGSKALLNITSVVLIISATASGLDSMAQFDEALEAMAVYEYGQDSAPVDQVEATIMAAVKDPKQRRVVEERLLKALASATTRGAKSLLCKQLHTIGTDRAVPQLEAMLTDRDLSHMARYALGRIEGTAALEALHRTLGKASGELQVGIIQTLADRDYRKALTDIATLLIASNDSVAESAAGALGHLGGDEAVKALEAARPAASGELRKRIDNALLVCAGHYMREGHKAGAARLYEIYYAPTEPTHLRIGALRGLVEMRGDDAIDLLVNAIKDPDPQLRADAIGFTRVVKTDGAGKTFGDLMPLLTPRDKELLTRALGDRGTDVGASVLMAAAKSDHDRSASPRLKLWAAQAALQRWNCWPMLRPRPPVSNNALPG